ncbi:hypothetical protein ACJIZ3_015080 [Penstemon smallii]|uniref:UBA domain-containing protein n=1 Tax=Penstemon smallii TaxID=265156 RepID=A0ABD3RLH2_9LAMI
MNNSTTSQYMDKQIMDLSNSQSTVTTNNNSDFIDFMKRSPEKKNDIVPSYDFMPIRPAVGSSSPPPPTTRSSNFDSGDDDAPIRTWNSMDSKTNASLIRNYSSIDADEPAKKPANASPDVSLISEIDRIMKKYMDNLVHAVDGVSARLSQLETRSRKLECLVDDLKVTIENNHGSTDGKMRNLENILREVQSGVQDIKDKQEIFEAQLQIAKLHLPKVEQVESQNTAHPNSSQPGQSVHQQFSTASLTQPPPALPPPNAPPPPPPQQNFQPQVQLPNQFPQNQVPSVPQGESYFPPPHQAPENPSHQYQIPPPQPQQQHPPPPPPQHQYQSPPPPQYSQPSPPSQPHPSFSAVNPSLPQPPMGHHPEEAPYAPSQTYPPSHPSIGGPPPPSQQFYGPPPSLYEPQSSRPGPGYSGSFAPSSGHIEPYPYSNSPSQYGSGSPVKTQQHSSPFTGQGGGSGYPQLPTARILPQAIPTATGIGGGGGSGSGSGGSSNKVPIDDVVDKVTNMGFSRDQVRATVRKLTENGQAVDLNIVLDKLMNDGDGQAQRSWPFGR